MKASLLTLLVCGALGCVPTGGYVVAYDGPPPPRVEYSTYRPGFVWVHGAWHRGYGGRWAWHDGYYQRERIGYRWQDGYWAPRGGGYVWVQGGWRPRGQVTIRGRF